MNWQSIGKVLKGLSSLTELHAGRIWSVGRLITVDVRLRAEIVRALGNSAYAYTSPHLGMSAETIRKLRDGTQERFHVGKLAKLCLNLGIAPKTAEDLGHPPLAAEMTLLQSHGYNEALLRTMEPRRNVR